MQISKLRIRNFRSIIDTSFEVPQLCALIGPNNSGKSNVLAALNIVLGDRWPTVRAFDDRDHYGYETERDIVISVWFDEPREVRGDVGEPQDYTGIEYRLTRYKRRSGRHEAGDPRGLFYCIDDEGDQVEILRMPPSGNRPYSTPASVSSDIREGLPAVFIDVDRSATYHLSGSQRSILGRLLKRVAKDFHSDEDRVAHFNQAFERARRHLRTEEFLAVRDRVVDHLRAHTGMDDIDVILDDVDPMNIYQTFSILFQDSETPAPVDAKRMGTGIQSAVVIAILQTFREFERQDALLLFEEPELFLHPHGRRHLFRLMQSLSADGTQIIYTTHSQEFLDLESLDILRLVKKPKNVGTKVTEPSSKLLVEDWRERARIAKKFGPPRTEILFAKRVVLVEGETERAAIAILAELYPSELSLDMRNCSIVDCGGKQAIPHYARVCQSVGKPVMVVFDTDSHLTDEDKVNVNRARNDAISNSVCEEGLLYSFDPYIEEEIGIEGDGKTAKDTKMREFLLSLDGWESVPDPLRQLIQEIDTFTSADA